MRYILIVGVVILIVVSGQAFAGFCAYVAGFHSDNVVKFDLATGEAQVVFTLEASARPRGITLDKQGCFYVGLRGATQNVKRFTAGEGIEDFTT